MMTFFVTFACKCSFLVIIIIIIIIIVVVVVVVVVIIIIIHVCSITEKNPFDSLNQKSGSIKSALQSVSGMLKNEKKNAYLFQKVPLFSNT